MQWSRRNTRVIIELAWKFGDVDVQAEYVSEAQYALNVRREVGDVDVKGPPGVKWGDSERLNLPDHEVRLCAWWLFVTLLSCRAAPPQGFDP